jgi:hypothetical protein
VAIASEISSKRSSMSERRLREIVQHTGSTVLVSNLFDEMRVFLNCLGDHEAQMRFLGLIPSNILDKTGAIQVCEAFNGLAPGTLRHFGEDSSEIFHPFRDLYFAGMLGVVERDPELGVAIQRFRRPHDPLAQGSMELPDSPVYLIHPALDTFIRAQRTRTPFLQFQHVTVGERMVWESHFPTIMQIEKQLQTSADERFVELAHQVVKKVQALLNAGRQPLARIEVERSAEWQTLTRQENRPDYDGALLWLDELLGVLA